MRYTIARMHVASCVVVWSTRPRRFLFMPLLHLQNISYVVASFLQNPFHAYPHWPGFIANLYCSGNHNACAGVIARQLNELLLVISRAHGSHCLPDLASENHLPPNRGPQHAYQHRFWHRAFIYQRAWSITIAYLVALGAGSPHAWHIGIKRLHNPSRCSAPSALRVTSLAGWRMAGSHIGVRAEVVPRTPGERFCMAVLRRPHRMHLRHNLFSAEWAAGQHDVYRRRPVRGERDKTGLGAAHDGTARGTRYAQLGAGTHSFSLLARDLLASSVSLDSGASGPSPHRGAGAGVRVGVFVFRAGGIAHSSVMAPTRAADFILLFPGSWFFIV